MRDLAFVASWLVLLPLSFRGAQFGMLLWAWTSLLAPNDILYGIGASVPFAKVAALPTVLQLLFRRDPGIRFRLDRTGILLLGLAVAAVVAQAASPMLDASAGWDLCQQFLKILALALVVLWCVTDRMRVHALLMVICLGIGYIAVDEGIKFILSGSGHKVLGSPSIGDNNQVALDVLMILPLLHYLHGSAASRPLRVACLGTALLGAVTVVATFSRGGFVGLLIVAAGSVASSRRKLLAIPLLACGLLAGAVLVGSDWTARMQTVQDANSDDSFLGRTQAWKVSLGVALDHPLTGGGMHAIQHGEVWGTQARNFQMLDFVPSLPLGSFPRAAHSIYFEVLGDMGFTGLGLFLLLMAVAWRDAGLIRRLVRRSGQPELDWAARLAGHLRLSLLAFMVSGGLLSAAYRDVDYLVVGLLAATRLIVRRALQDETAPLPAGTRHSRPVGAPASGARRAHAADHGDVGAVVQRHADAARPLRR